MRSRARSFGPGARHVQSLVSNHDSFGDEIETRRVIRDLERHSV